MKKVTLSLLLLLFAISLFAQAPRPFPAGLAPCLEDDFRELEKFYDATNGDNWKDKSNWFTNPDLESWYGIILTQDGCDVDYIHLIFNNLSGQLFDINLPSLTYYDVSGNQLSGSIPDFKNLPNLVSFACQSNQLTGSIPDFKNLPNLHSFICTSNKLTGSIPDFTNLPKLVELYCYNNQLKGGIPDFTNLPKLIKFSCGGNQLSGNIPNFKNLPNLVNFRCYSNKLTGIIPDFNSMAELKEFECSFNELIGNIPDFKNLPNLSILGCSFNLFDFGNFDALSKNSLLFNNTSYIPQKTRLPILYQNNALVADTAGATLDKLTYTWYRNQKLYKIVANNNQLPNTDRSGRYFYTVMHSGLKQLTLISDTIQIGAKAVGKVFGDSNKDCTLNNNEKGRKSIIIRFENAKDTVTTVSDINGNFEISLDTLPYKMYVKTGNLWTTCALPIIKPTSWNDSLNLNIPMQAVTDCPSLEVSLSTQRLRRCFDNTYIVKYANRGTVVANNAYVVVDFDKWLQVKSATKSYTQFPNNQYRFNLGNLAVDEEGTFSVVVKVDCDSTVLGQTHCSTAHIYPDTLCVNPALWDKSSLDVKATCNNGKLRFEVKNVGIAPNSQSLQSIVVEDQIMMLQTPINLNPGGIKVFDFTPKGKTVRVQVEQSAFHPSGNAFVSAAVEGCGGSPTLGMITQFSQNDREPYIDIDCRQNIGAYDPNEKMATPVGYKSSHKIEPNTNITYQIDFQNQGSDTAFTVVLRDTIDQNFDITTLRMGASSHPYSWTIENKNTLKVTFDKIHLTTKKQDEAKSQGFVVYEIAQKRDLKLGKTLKNSAGIYFDFNLPIITNTVKHSIDKNYISLVAVQDIIDNGMKVNVAPNPFHNEAIFSIENTDNQLFNLKIFDNLGRLIHQQTSENGQINYQNIAHSGIYFYRIAQGGKIASGKLIAQ